MAYYWIAGTDTWDSSAQNGSKYKWSSASPTVVASGSSTSGSTTFTTTASVTLATGAQVVAADGTLIGSISTGATGTSFTLSAGALATKSGVFYVSNGTLYTSLVTTDDYLFDTSTGTFTVTISTGITCRDFNASGSGVTFSYPTGPTWNVGGSFSCASGYTWSGTNLTINFTSTVTGKTVTTGVVITSGTLTFIGAGGGWTVSTTGGAALCSIITFNAGLVTIGNSFSIVNHLTGTGSNARTLALGSNNLTIPGIVQFTGGGLTVNGTGSLIVGSDFTGGGNNFLCGKVQLNGTTSSQTVGGVNTFTSLEFVSDATAIRSLIFSANQTITTFLANGASQIRRNFIRSNAVGTTRTLTIGTWTSPANIDFRDITIAGGVGTIAPTSSGDCGGNSGINFATNSAPKTVYWNKTASGTVQFFTTSAAWSTTDTTTQNGSDTNFPLAQDTIIITNNNLAASATLAAAAGQGYNIGKIDTSTRTNSLVWNVIGASYYGDIIFGTATTISGNPTINIANTVSSGAVSVSLNDQTIGSINTTNATNPVVTFNAGFTCSTSAGINHSKGTLNLNGKSISTPAVTFNSTTTFSTSAITLTSSVATSTFGVSTALGDQGAITSTHTTTKTLSISNGVSLPSINFRLSGVNGTTTFGAATGSSCQVGILTNATTALSGTASWSPASRTFTTSVSTTLTAGTQILSGQIYGTQSYVGTVETTTTGTSFPLIDYPTLTGTAATLCYVTTGPCTVIFGSAAASGANNTFTSFYVSGVAGSPATINSVTAGTAATLNSLYGDHSNYVSDYLTITDVKVGGVGQWYAGKNSTLSGVTGTGWIKDRSSRSKFMGFVNVR